MQRGHAVAPTAQTVPRQTNTVRSPLASRGKREGFANAIRRLSATLNDPGLFLIKSCDPGSDFPAVIRLTSKGVVCPKKCESKQPSMFSLKVFPTQGWFRHRLKPFSALIGASVVMGLVSGLGTVYLLSLINQALVGEAGLAGGLLLAFAGLCAVTLLTRAGSDIATNLIGQKLVAEVRTWLGRKILSAPVEALERYKAHKILPVLTHDPDVWDDDVDAASRASDRDASARIELDRVTYAFPAPEGAKSFALGPIDLTFQPGKITFIVGDNGSGKTTLIKLLLGLYAPQEGAIVVNGKAVTAATRDDYRQMFSIVLSDFHLFETVQTPLRLVQAEILSYLEKLELSDKVSVAGDRFTTTDLSTGQRKRLALIHVWLEERPVIVFDEWAADQDPTFRRVFYEELLPDLKRQGKTLIVISHDDRYFGIADRIVRLRAGQVVTDEPVARVALGEQA